MKTPTEWRKRLKADRLEAAKAATVFARICVQGNADQLYNAHLLLNECVDAWRPAMAKVAKLPHVSREIQQAFLSIWVESKMLPRQVGNRRVLASALRVLMPGSYTGRPLTLYRGATYNERRRRIYGFSWTKDAAVARTFAENWAQAIPGINTEGVILQTVAPREAILLIRQPEDYYDEGEVVVDPFRLDQINIAERLTPA